MAEMLAVRIDEPGVLHVEDGRLIVGDLDVVAAAVAAWGGTRQRARVVVEIYLQSRETTNMEPTWGGVFSEGSEPK